MEKKTTKSTATKGKQKAYNAPKGYKPNIVKPSKEKAKKYANDFIMD